MRPAHPIETRVGIDHYVSDADGIGGRLRERPAEFRVRELERFDAEPIDADPGAYPHVVCRIRLRGWDTNDFAGRLSDALGISRERIDWAGTKDKRALTTQLFSVRDVAPERLRAVSIDRADVEVLGRAGRAIEFGDLTGNAFEIVVRDPDRPDNAGPITAELSGFARTAADDPLADRATVAVPNYFGQQRFGSRRPVTHEVGLAVVRGDWEAAVRTYVANPMANEPEDTRTARGFVDDVWADRDWTGMLDRLPRRLGYERSMVHALADAGDDPDPVDFRSALAAVPANLQRLFVHAAQSFLFNRILSERLARGLPFDRPVAGDVVCFADRETVPAPAGSSESGTGVGDPPSLVLPDTDRRQRVTADRVETVARHCERGRAFVTAPLVGTDTDLGDGDPGAIERSVLDDAGLAPGDFALPGNFDSAGTRRAVLLRTDLAIDPDAGGGSGALTFDFALPKGSYATTLLREYLKGDPFALG